VSTFEEVRERATPDWMGPTGKALARVQGADQDAALADLKAAVKIRWPAFATGDALVECGHDRALERAPIETDLEYQARLERVWDIWQVAGTPAGIGEIFAVYGYTGATMSVLARHQADDFLGVLGGFEFPWASEFVIVLGPGYFQTTGDVWGDAPEDVWDATSLWGVTGTTYDLAWIRRQIRRFKSPQSYPVAIYVDGGDGVWGDPGVWNDGGLWDGAPAAIIWPLWPVWDSELLDIESNGLWSDDDTTWLYDFDSRLPRP
jgi:hypothetical protein